jgi:hypothetical protein
VPVCLSSARSQLPHFQGIVLRVSRRPGGSLRPHLHTMFSPRTGPIQRRRSIKHESSYCDVVDQEVCLYCCRPGSRSSDLLPQQCQVVCLLWNDRLKHANTPSLPWLGWRKHGGPSPEYRARRPRPLRLPPPCCMQYEDTTVVAPKLDSCSRSGCLARLGSVLLVTAGILSWE